MEDHIYKQIELTGSSPTSIEDAIQNAIAKASKTLHNIHWFQVTDTRGYIADNKVDYWQVTIKLAFALTTKKRPFLRANQIHLPGGGAHRRFFRRRRVVIVLLKDKDKPIRDKIVQRLAIIE